ncbi:MAG: DnaJ domain-containing protein [Brumimicrobium sp.]|nr:DnaJ domain-containing protein [Brumimicrobium sp.]
MSAKYYFDILEIAPTKDEEIIKKAYRKLALQYHPDRNQSESAMEKFIEINEAYEQILYALDKLKSKQSVSPSTTHSVRYRKATREEKIAFARKQYERMKKRTEEEDNVYFVSLTTGKKWRYFQIVLSASLGILFLLLLDIVILKHVEEEVYIIKPNTILEGKYSELSRTSFSNGQHLFLSKDIIRLIGENPIQLRRTHIFREIIDLHLMKENKIYTLQPEYGIYNYLFPLIIALLLPSFAYLKKGKNVTFSFLFNLSIYVLPFIYLIFLFLNNRWVHLFTLGYY